MRRKNHINKILAWLGYSKNSYIQSRDFSSVEDSPQAFFLIREIASKAGQSAAAEARAMGLPRTFARENQVIRAHADGKEEVLPANLPFNKSFYVYYKPKTVFHTRKVDRNSR